MIAKMTISQELLLEALHLPPDTEIVDCACSRWKSTDDTSVEFIVSHKDITTKEVRPVHLTHLDENAHIIKVEFVSWK